MWAVWPTLGALVRKWVCFCRNSDRLDQLWNDLDRIWARADHIRGRSDQLPEMGSLPLVSTTFGVALALCWPTSTRLNCRHPHPTTNTLSERFVGGSRTHIRTHRLVRCGTKPMHNLWMRLGCVWGVRSIGRPTEARDRRPKVGRGGRSHLLAGHGRWRLVI